MSSDFQIRGDAGPSLDIRRSKDTFALNMFSREDIRTGQSGAVPLAPDHVIAGCLIPLSDNIAELNGINPQSHRLSLFRRGIASYEFRWISRKLKTADQLVSLK